MVSFTFTRPTIRPSSTDSGSTPRPDFLRGSSRNDEFVRDLIEDPARSVFEQTIFDQLTTAAPRREAFWLIVTGVVTRPLNATELVVYQLLVADPESLGLPAGTVLTPEEALATVAAIYGPLDTGPAPDNSDFGGGDSIFGRGGDDVVIDLAGDNSLRTDGGDDWIRLGTGRDRVFDRGGDNDILILGGDNSVTTRDGDDLVVTGDGDDAINVGDGDNTVEAGDGDNVVTGGDGLDFVEVGIGSDIVSLGQGSASSTIAQDLSGFLLDIVFEGHNWVFDAGGSDVFTTAGTARSGPDDQTFNGDDAVIDDLGLVTGAPDVVGDDTASLGEGSNLYLGYGGNDTVITGAGDDFVFTSYFGALTGSTVFDGDDNVIAGDGANFVQTYGGDDTITSGAGNDTITAGTGEDRIDSGAGRDTIFTGTDNGLPDASADTTRVEPADVPVIGANTPAAVQAAALAADLVWGLDGADTFQFSTDFTSLLGITEANVFQLSAETFLGLNFTSGPDGFLLIDTDASLTVSAGDGIAAVLPNTAGAPLIEFSDALV